VQSTDALAWKVDQLAKKLAALPASLRDTNKKRISRIGATVGAMFASMNLVPPQKLFESALQTKSRVDEVEKKLKVVPGQFGKVRNQKLATEAVIALVSEF